MGEKEGKIWPKKHIKLLWSLTEKKKNCGNSDRTKKKKSSGINSNAYKDDITIFYNWLTIQNKIKIPISYLVLKINSRNITELIPNRITTIPEKKSWIYKFLKNVKNIITKEKNI